MESRSLADPRLATRPLSLFLAVIVVSVLGAGTLGCQRQRRKPDSSFKLVGMGGVRHVGYLNSRGLVVIATDDRVVRLWDPQNGKVTAEISERAQMPSMVAIDPKEQWIAVANEGGVIRLWNVDKNVVAESIEAPIHFGRKTLIAGPDGDTLAFAAKDLSIRLWRISTRHEEGKLVGHKVPVSAIAISRDGSKLASGDQDGNLIIWDIRSGGIDHRIPAHDQFEVRDLLFVGERAVPVAAGFSRSVSIWDATSGTRLALLQGDMNSILCLGQSSDGKLLASGDVDAEVVFWDTTTWERKGLIRAAHFASITSLTFMKNKAQIATACDGIDFQDRRGDGEVKVWRLE